VRRTLGTTVTVAARSLTALWYRAAMAYRPTIIRVRRSANAGKTVAIRIGEAVPRLALVSASGLGPVFTVGKAIGERLTRVTTAMGHAIGSIFHASETVTGGRSERKGSEEEPQASDQNSSHVVTCWREQ